MQRRSARRYHQLDCTKGTTFTIALNIKAVNALLRLSGAIEAHCVAFINRQCPSRAERTSSFTNACFVCNGCGPYRKPFNQPVSYTHLRAHETDSYLVCRLLLEKKKSYL